MEYKIQCPFCGEEMYWVGDQENIEGDLETIYRCKGCGCEGTFSQPSED